MHKLVFFCLDDNPPKPGAEPYDLAAHQGPVPLRLGSREMQEHLAATLQDTSAPMQLSTLHGDLLSAWNDTGQRSILYPARAHEYRPDLTVYVDSGGFLLVDQDPASYPEDDYILADRGFAFHPTEGYTITGSRLPPEGWFSAHVATAVEPVEREAADKAERLQAIKDEWLGVGSRSGIVDVEFGRAKREFVTAEAETVYLIKLAELERYEAAFAADPAHDPAVGTYPVCDSEIGHTGATRAEVMALIRANADAWLKVALPRLEGHRMDIKASIRDATTIAEARAAAARMDWDACIAAIRSILHPDSEQ